MLGMFREVLVMYVECFGTVFVLMSASSFYDCQYISKMKCIVICYCMFYYLFLIMQQCYSNS